MQFAFGVEAGEQVQVRQPVVEVLEPREWDSGHFRPLGDSLEMAAAGRLVATWQEWKIDGLQVQVSVPGDLSRPEQVAWLPTTMAPLDP